MSGPADLDTVTGCRPADPQRAAPWIPEFRDVVQQPDGTWTAVHESGQAATAPDLRRLVFVAAPAVRILLAWRRA